MYTLGMTKVYVGCSLVKATEEFVAFVADFKRRLAEESGTEVLEFVGLSAGTPAVVYETDIGNVEQCDVLIAFVDEPSTGLGMEIQHAMNLAKPVLALAREGETVTRMVIGAAELGKIRFGRYVDISSALTAVDTFLATLPETPSSVS